MVLSNIKSPARNFKSMSAVPGSKRVSATTPLSARTHTTTLPLKTPTALVEPTAPSYSTTVAAETSLTSTPPTNNVSQSLLSEDMDLARAARAASGYGGGDIHFGQRIYVNDSSGSGGGGGSSTTVLELQQQTPAAHHISSSSRIADGTAAVAAEGEGGVQSAGQPATDVSKLATVSNGEWSRRDFIVVVTLFVIVIIFLFLIFVTQRTSRDKHNSSDGKKKTSSAPSL